MKRVGFELEVDGLLDGGLVESVMLRRGRFM